jgi:glycosyltransferase involved in cell wall biosynthesis
VLQVGRLAPVKGTNVMLQAWQMARRHRADARLGLVGDGPERASLEALAHNLGIADSVVFWGNTRDTPAFYSEADLFVLSSLEEGMPNALLEAMASGLACIASDLPGTRGIIDHGRSGLLVPPGDPAALCSAMLQLLGNPDQRNNLGLAARKQVQAWAMSRMIDAHIALHQRLSGIPGQSTSAEQLFSQYLQ